MNEPMLKMLSIVILLSLSGFYALWLLYLAVMNLKRVKELGFLSPIAYALGLPILAVGLTLDFLINVFVMTIILFELPKEMTVTARLKRHNRDSNGWRRTIAKWFEPLLDPFDPSGNHI